MSGLEAIPKISELLTRLIKLTKDREAGSLVQQIQQHQLEIHTALVVSDAKIRELEQQLTTARAEDVLIHKCIEFRRGRRTGGKWQAFCPKCHMPAQKRGVRTADGFTNGVVCSAHCGWHVFEDLSMDEIIQQLGV
jgi:hypothetical protein